MEVPPLHRVNDAFRITALHVPLASANLKSGEASTRRWSQGHWYACVSARVVMQGRTIAMPGMRRPDMVECAAFTSCRFARVKCVLEFAGARRQLGSGTKGLRRRRP